MKGHGWLPGQPISERWHVRAAKTLFSIRLGKMLQNEPASDQDVLVPYLKAVHVQWQGVRIDDLPEMWAGRAEIEQYGAHDGDLLVCEGGEVGRAASLTAGPRPCIIQNALHRVRSREHADSRFFKYVLEHLAISPAKSSELFASLLRPRPNSAGSPPSSTGKSPPSTSSSRRSSGSSRCSGRSGRPSSLRS